MPDEVLRPLPGGFAGLLVTPNPQEPDPCPDDFTITGILQLARKTRREATAAIEAAVARYLQQLEPQLNCAQFTCTEGACEFDAMVEYDPPRKVFQPTQKHGRKRRWIASATLLIGCFCRGSTDEDENDPPEEDENGHGKG